MRCVVAATDFSQHSMMAGARAARLAAESAAELRLVHVLEQEGLTVLRDWLAPGRDLQAAVATQARMLLDATARQLFDAHGVQAQTSVRSGQPLDELDDAARAADLLVLGDRGNHVLRDAAIGTTADRLLRTAARPLLVVKVEPVARSARVLVLVDFSPASEAAVAAALRLAPQANLRLLHAVGLPFEGKLRLAGVADEEIEGYRWHAKQRALEQFRQLLARTGAGERVSIAIEEGDVQQRFRQAMDDWRPDLVATGKQGQGLLSDLFLGSVTRMVLAEAPCDVLVVPQGAVSAAADVR
jgi:nucleotide-binding universal stress UspA family protein